MTKFDLRDYNRRMLAASLPEVWDPLPEDANDEIDVAAWVSEYRDRLRHVVLSGRNRARDKDMLRTLSLLMERAGTRLFEASRRELVTYSGCYAATVWAAVDSLRKEGYLRVMGLTGYTESEVEGGIRYPRHQYALIMERLPKRDGDAPPPPDTTMRRIVTGDFCHDAFAGHKGLKANRRQIWLWARENPGCAKADIARGTGVSKPTVGRAVKWLAENGLVDATALDEEGIVFATDPDREKALLAEVVQRNWLQGKTLNRLDYLDRPFDVIKEERRRQRRQNAASVAAVCDDEDAVERSMSESELVIRGVSWGD